MYRTNTFITHIPEASVKPSAAPRERAPEHIRLVNISKTFRTKAGEVKAVRDVSLDIRKGEVYGIIGFSGAGKSTLVRCINLLERPTEGSVIIDGKDLTALKDAELRKVRQSIGMIFQNFNLMPSRTVFENILLPLKLTSLSTEEKEKKVLSLLELVELSDKRDVYPSQLSGGQKQRVAIARALANDPEVLLCDEATSALDPQTTSSILSLIASLNKKLGITVVVITHQMSVIKEICDRVAVMEAGKVVEEGTVSQIFSAPKQPVTKGFIQTADNLSTFFAKLEEGTLPGISKTDPVWFLTFNHASAGEAFVSGLQEKFGIKSNIVYGNIDFLKGEVLGKLAVGVTGSQEGLNAGLAWLIQNNIAVEVLQ